MRSTGCKARLSNVSITKRSFCTDAGAASRTSDRKAVGFIGLGNMGGPMAANLVKVGFPLVVHDLNQESLKKLQALGGDKVTVATSPQEVTTKTQYTVTMLPSPSHVREVYTAENGIFASNDLAGKTLIDSSTIDVKSSKEISALAHQKRAYFVDAPVSGGVQGATEGTLTFMVGGPVQTFRRAEAILQHMGKKVFHCGPNGNGLIAKLANNLALGIEMIAVSEAMNFGMTLGMDPKLLAQIINSSSGRCWSSEVYNPVPEITPNSPANRNYEGGFSVSLMLKDLELALKSGEEPGVHFHSPIPSLLGTHARSVFRAAAFNGYADKDFSSVYKYLQDMSPKQETDPIIRSRMDQSFWEKNYTPFRKFRVGVDKYGYPVGKVLDNDEELLDELKKQIYAGPPK